MVLGGGGMVGRAVCRELMKNRPKSIVVCSLLQQESEDAISVLNEELQRTTSLSGESTNVQLIAEWGNLFVRTELKDRFGPALTGTSEGRRAIIDDCLTPMSAEVARRFYLYQIVLKYRPDIIIDAMNTATGIAYSDVYTQAREVWHDLQEDKCSPTSVERLLCSLYIPQLIRHVDVLYRGMVAVDTKAYVKLGTSGTGGMGWNIPYTHGEERPSSVLLSKSAVAGAHTLLLFLLARTPGIASLEESAEGAVVSKAPPATMEIKPTAMIGWRSIGYGQISKRGKPVILEDVSFESSMQVGNGTTLTLHDPALAKTGTDAKVLETVFVDTGENGLFSAEEFIAITSPGQMEFVTPEEIARNVVDEVRGHNSGKDVINALTVACMGPTYRAGFQRERAIRKIRELERQHNCESIAFENLGPPRLSKLLYEVSFLKRIYTSVQGIASADPAEMSSKMEQLLRSNKELLATPVTIGIPVLYQSEQGLELIRGSVLKTPPPQGAAQVTLDSVHLEEWTRAGWIDLRVSNMQRWKDRMKAILADANSISVSETSSRYVRDRDFWAIPDADNWEIQPGEIVAWIFINEDKGERGRE